MIIGQWPMKPLSELCEFRTGGTPSRSVDEYFENGDVPWLVSGDIHKKKITSCENRITKLGLQNSSAKLLPANSVLIALSGQGKTRGTVAILEAKSTACNQSIACMTPINRSDIDHRFLYYYLEGRYHKLRGITGHNDRRGLNLRILKKIEIPLPPLEEQRRIISILDEAFEVVESRIESLQTKLQSIEEIYSNYRSSIFEEIQKTNENLNLPDICETIFAGGDKPKDNFSKFKTDEFSVPIFSNGRKDKGLFGYTDVGRVEKKCITISARGTIGYSEIREPNFLPIVRLIVAVPKTDVIIVEYLKHFFDYKNFSNTGSSIPQLTVPMVKQYIVPVPPLSEQTQISNKLDDMLELAEQTIQLIERKLESFEELMQSILQEAFSGKLTGGIAA